MMLLTIISQLSSPTRRLVYQSTSDTDDYSFYSRLGLFPKANLSTKDIDASAIFNIVPRKLLNRFGLTLDRDIDIVLDASGFAYSDQWGYMPTKIMAQKVVKWSRQGTKTILLPQAYGPFTSARIRKYMKVILKHSHLVYARDKTSLKYLQDINPSAHNIRLSPDFTCLLESKPHTEHFAFKGSVCLTPNARILDKTQEKDSYIAFFSRVINLLGLQGIQAFFLVHGGNEDLRVVNTINSYSHQPVPIVHCDDPYMVKQYISQSRLLIGSRYHSIASAFYSGVPAFGIGWSHKYNHLFDDFSQSKCLIKLPVTEHVYQELLGKLTDHDWLKSTTNKLNEVTMRYQNQSRQLFAELSNLAS